MRLTDAAPSASRRSWPNRKADRGRARGVKKRRLRWHGLYRWNSESAAKFDEVVENKGVKLLIDPKRCCFLLAARDVFKVDKLSSTFSVQQPEPDLGLRLRHRAAHAGLRSGRCRRH